MFHNRIMLNMLKPAFSYTKPLYETRSLYFQIRRNYFAKYLDKYECRKEILKENKILNNKVKKVGLAIHHKTWTYMKENKKKLIFFLIMLGLLQYMDGYRSLMNWYKYKEPFKYKLKRWLFGEKNVVLPTITEQRLQDFKLSQLTLEILAATFLEKDKKLKLGVTRYYLCKIYEDLGLFVKKDDKGFFYGSSGYSKKRNQKIASINLREFVNLFSEALKKKKKQDQTITEEAFRQQFLEKFENYFGHITTWEVKQIDKRAQFKLMMPHIEESKKDILKKEIISQPLIQLDDLNNKVKSMGLGGLSVREKVTILSRQQTLLLLYKSNYQEKSDRPGNQDKTTKYNIKIHELDERLTQISGDIEKYTQEFKALFKGKEVFPIIDHDQRPN